LAKQLAAGNQVFTNKMVFTIGILLLAGLILALAIRASERLRYRIYEVAIPLTLLGGTTLSLIPILCDLSNRNNHR